MVTEIDEFLVSNAELIFCLFAAVLLLIHFRSKFRIPILILGMLVVLVAFAFVVLYFRPEPVRLTLVGSILVLYGTTLFVILSDAMKMGLAEFLTAKRGHNWTKEMDYLYLTIGLLGVLVSINRIEFLSGRFENVDILAPLLLVTAFVMRMLKTRAEIADWNK